MTLGVLTTLWRRHDLERLTLRQISSANIDGVEIKPLAVGSEGEASRRVAEDNGWYYLEHANDPLGAKHNAGMQVMREFDPDAVMVIGSDDLVSHSYLEEAAGYVRRGAEYVVPQTLYVYDAQKKRCMYVYGFRVGTGRITHRKALDACDWTPWENDINESLDGSLHQSVRDHVAGEVFIGDLRKRGHAIVDVKTEVNIWSYDHLMGALHWDEVDAEELLEEHFDGVTDKLLAW